MKIDHYGVSIVWEEGVSKATVCGSKKPCNFLKDKVVFAEAKQVETHPHPNHLLTTRYLCFYK